MPPRAGSYIDELLDFCDVIGFYLDEWQQMDLDAILSVDAGERWTCTEFGDLVARQNGKGGILTPYTLGHLFLWPRSDGEPKLVVHTAHEFKTAGEAFRRARRVIEGSPLLMAEMKDGINRGISTANGEQGFELANGNRLRYLTRSKSAGVGFSCDTLVVDEAQQTPLSAMDALLPTMAAVPNHQILFTGTVPDELDDAEYWEGLRDRGREGSDPRGGWIERTPDDSDDPELAEKIDIADERVWEESNPALGRRITRETVEDEYRRLAKVNPDAFRRERLSIWPNRRPQEAVQLSELDIEQWKRNIVPGAVLGDAPVIAIALGKGGGYATVAVGSFLDDDQIFVEHKKTERQTRWVAKYVRELRDELGAVLVVLDPKNASVILTDLDSEGVKYLSLALSEIGGAHALFLEYSNEGLAVHRGQAEVTKSLEFATTRSLSSSGQTWEPSDPTKPISQAQAVTWALWGVKKAQSAPPKKPAVVRGYA